MFFSPRTRRPFLLILATGLLLVGGLGCDLGGAGSSEATVAGQALDAASDPVVGAQVIIAYTDETGEQVEETTTTDSTGRFNERIDVDEPTEIVITVSKQGVDARRTRQVSPDAGASDLSFTLDIGGEEDREPGRPTDIVLQDQSASSIRVQESGGTPD